MAANIKAFLALETALAERLKKSWRELAMQTFIQVKAAVDRRDYNRAVEIARNVDLSKVLKENRAQMEMSAYSSLLFGAMRITKRAKNTCIMKGDFSRVVEDAIISMEQTIKLSAEEQVRDSLLEFIYQEDMRDPRTPFSNLTKAEWVKKYDPDQPRAPKGTEIGGQWIAVSTGATYDLAVEEGNNEPVSGSEILDRLSDDDREEYEKTLNAIVEELKAGKETSKIHSKNGDGTGGYTDERKAVHARVLSDMFKDARDFLPEGNKAPTVIFLGGRGGSGKSAFGKELGVYDEKKYFVLDADAVKNALAVQDGMKNGVENKAALYHKESDDVAIAAMKRARSMGLNVVIDATLKSPGKGRIAKTFQKEGYRIEGHYMFLPRKVAAERAVKRYLGKGPGKRGRLVPPAIILKNTRNERNFDRMIPLFDNWSVYNNNVPFGEPPKLVLKGKKGG